MTVTILVDGEPVTVDLNRTGGRVHGTAGATSVDATITRTGDTWRVTLGDEAVTLTAVRERDAAWIAVDGEVYRCVAGTDARGGGGAAAIHSPHVVAPMPGKVLEVRVAEGQTVAAGDPLVILEAMKMETIAAAEAPGRVVKVHVAAGAMVEPGQALVDLELDEPA